MRISYSEDEDFPGQFALWEANSRRSLAGKKGQAALRELEQALLALPEKKLIANKLQDAEGQVCALGALAKYKGRELAVLGSDEEDEWEDYDGFGQMEEVGVELGVPRLVAWRIVALNDIEIDGHYEDVAGPPLYGYRLPGVFVAATPEERYEKVLAWVRNRIKQTGVINETQN